MTPRFLSGMTASSWENARTNVPTVPTVRCFSLVLMGGASKNWAFGMDHRPGQAKSHGLFFFHGEVKRHVSWDMGPLIAMLSSIHLLDQAIWGVDPVLWSKTYPL